MEQSVSDGRPVRIGLFGHSHINCLVRSLEAGDFAGRVEYASVPFKALVRSMVRSGRDSAEERRETIQRELARIVASLSGVSGTVAPAFLAELAERNDISILLSMRGNQHLAKAMAVSKRPYDFVLPDEPDLPLDPEAQIIPADLVVETFRNSFKNSFEYIKEISDLVPRNLYYLETPPPYGDADYIKSKILDFNMGARVTDEGAIDIAPALLRYKVWRCQSKALREYCECGSITWVPCPEMVKQDGKYLHPDGWYRDAVHGNKWFGQHMIQAALDKIAEPKPDVVPGVTTVRPYTPYRDQPERAFWRKALAEVPSEQVDPVGNWTLRIAPSTKVATAGSCFAQHIADRLARSGYNYFVTETPPDLVTDAEARKYGYRVFSARYGNIYTARQLLQTFDRVYGHFNPAEDIWETPDGRFIDPFRPNIQDGGFASRHDFYESRKQHFAAVRQMFEELDVFVFTLGLTEAWECVADGAVFPLAPGVSGGTFDASRHRLRNQTVTEVCQDLRAFLTKLRQVNPKSSVILTVSPVPLIATATANHVLAATVYSKSVLRIAADEISATVPDVHYFPSFEVVTGPHARGAYLGEDLREVRPEGVDHVMRLFFKHATGQETPPVKRKADRQPSEAASNRRLLRRRLNVICDEDSITK